MFVSKIIKGNIVNKYKYNRILLNKEDQKEWELKRTVRNIKAIIEGRVTNIQMWLNKNKFLKIEV